MRKPIFIILAVLIVMTAAVYFIAYGTGYKRSSDNTASGRGKKNSPGSENTQTKAPVDVNTSKISFDEFIPEVDFATLRFAFVTIEGLGKTYLYTGADFSATEEYVKKLAAGGYQISSNESSKKNDKISAKLVNEQGNVYVSVEYENTGLTIEVTLEGD